MVYREFIVPSHEAIVDALGVEPEISAGDVDTWVLRLAAPEGESFIFSYSVPDRSVRCQWMRDGAPVVDIFREGAASFAVESDRRIAKITVFFEVDGLCGQLDLQVLPRFSVIDKLLFS